MDIILKELDHIPTTIDKFKILNKSTYFKYYKFEKENLWIECEMKNINIFKKSFTLNVSLMKTLNTIYIDRNNTFIVNHVKTHEEALEKVFSLKYNADDINLIINSYVVEYEEKVIQIPIYK